MELHFTPEQEAHLCQIAKQEGKTPEELIADAVLDRSIEDRLVSRTLDQRVQRANSGAFHEEDEMDRRYRAMMGR